MIHIVFNEPDINVLQKAIELDESLTRRCNPDKDDYAVGPVKNIFDTEAVEARVQWWHEVLAGGDYDGLADNENINDNKTIIELKERLNNNEDELSGYGLHKQTRCMRLLLVDEPAERLLWKNIYFIFKQPSFSLMKKELFFIRTGYLKFLLKNF